jgi:hypothetical protein
MSRDLPVQASIEHLKKQAKYRLVEMRRSQPARGWRTRNTTSRAVRVCELAEAANLRRIRTSGDVRFDRFTAKARQALFFSRYEASELGSRVIDPEHILLGLVRAGQHLTNDVLARAGLSLAAARAEIAPPSPREPLDSSVVIPFSTVTTLVLRAARAEADRLAHDRIGLAHVVLGLLRARESVAASILRRIGIGSDLVREALLRR